MPLPLPRDESIKVHFSICKPVKGYTIDDALAHVAKLVATLEEGGNAEAAILRSIDDSWVAVFSSWKEASADESIPNVEAAEFCKSSTSSVRMVESRWLQLSCGDYTDISFARLRVGDAISVRRIYGSRKKQEVLAYSCLALLKSYFKQTQGIRSYTYYKSIDGKRIMGLGIWDSIQSASSMLDSCGEPYWYGLGAKILKISSLSGCCCYWRQRYTDTLGMKISKD